VIFGKVVLKDELWVITVAEEVTLSDWLDLVIVELEGVFVCELYNAVLKASDRLEKLI